MLRHEHNWADEQGARCLQVHAVITNTDTGDEMNNLIDIVEEVLERHLRPSEWSKLDGNWRNRKLYPTVAERIEQADYRKSQGAWFPACNGTETPFTSRSGHRLL